MFQNVEGAALAAPFAFGGERRGLRRFVGPAWIRAESRVELVRAQAGVPVLLGEAAYVACDLGFFVAGEDVYRDGGFLGGYIF